MTLRTKKRLVAALLVVLGLWPLVHRGLALRYGMNPWKFFGWAMYITPALPAQLSLFKLTDDGSLEELAASRLPPGKEGVLADFADWRKYGGSWVQPDEVADAVFEARPDLDAIAIVLTDRFLNPRTAIVEVQHYGYRYRRGAAGSE